MPVEFYNLLPVFSPSTDHPVEGRSVVVLLMLLLLLSLLSSWVTHRAAAAEAGICPGRDVLAVQIHLRLVVTLSAAAGNTRRHRTMCGARTAVLH